MNLYETIREIIADQIQAFTQGFAPPEEMVVLDFNAGQGTASSKSSTTGPVKITSRLDLQPGMRVVGIPVERGYAVVGIVSNS